VVARKKPSRKPSRKTRRKSTANQSAASKRTQAKKPATPAKRRAPAHKAASAGQQKKRSFLRGFIIFVIGGLLGTGLGFMAGIFIYPYIFPPPPANEIVTKEEQKGLVAVGTFIHANPRDPVHFGSGSVTVYRKLVHLGPDFKVGPGPAFHVYLSPRENIRKNSDFAETAALDLGKLRSFEGSQKFPIPEGTDLSKYKTVLIWCKEFGVLISPADLDKVSMMPASKKP